MIEGVFVSVASLLLAEGYKEHLLTAILDLVPVDGSH